MQKNRTQIALIENTNLSLKIRSICKICIPLSYSIEIGFD